MIIVYTPTKKDRIRALEIFKRLGIRHIFGLSEDLLHNNHTGAPVEAYSIASRRFYRSCRKGNDCDEVPLDDLEHYLKLALL
jgi:hypothetical protein